MKRTKRNIKLEFTGRPLTTDEADAIRELAASFKPKLHLVKSGWSYFEVRGIRDEAAAKVLDALSALGLSYREYRG